ncbi:hypothetical protein F7Q95_05880 [Pseudomonas psychrophila]|nr:hypothetical protein F7Q95_05880 [Pseudomonas psychrophila]
MSVDETQLQFSYRFVESPLPVDNYVATVRMIPLSYGHKTVILWAVTFERVSQTELTATIESLIVGGHENFQLHLSRTATA